MTNHSDSLDEGWVDSPFSDGAYAQNENPMLGEMPEHPLHVKVVDTQTQQTAPEFAAWSNFPIGVVGTNPPTQLCPHKYHRSKAKFTVNWGDTDAYNTQPVTAGAAGFVYLSNVVNGYLTGFSYNLSSPDANAITLSIQAIMGEPGDPVYFLPAGQTSLSVTFPVPLFVGLSTSPRLSFSATATATGYANIYGTEAAATLYIANKPNSLTSGALQNVYALTPGMPFPDYEGQQEVWAIASQAGVEVNVLDETYGTVQ